MRTSIDTALEQRRRYLSAVREAGDLTVAQQYTPYTRPQSVVPCAADAWLQLYLLASSVTEHQHQFLRTWNPPYQALVVDVGCGTGAFAAGLAAHRPDLRWALLGQNLGQLQHGASPLSRVAGDMHALPFAAHSVDCLLYIYVLGYGFLPRVCAEAWRVLRPGGTVIIDDLCTRPQRQSTETLLLLLGYKSVPPQTLEDRFRECGFQQEGFWRAPQTSVNREVQEQTPELLMTLTRETVPVFAKWRKPEETLHSYK